MVLVGVEDVRFGILVEGVDKMVERVRTQFIVVIEERNKFALGNRESCQIG